MKKSAGYTLIEVAVAAAILVLILAGAAAMSFTIVTQQESNTRVARALNYQEQIARLYQLGLTPTDAIALCPLEPEVSSILPIATGTSDISGVGSLDWVTFTMTFQPSPAVGTWTAGAWTAGTNSDTRTRTMTVYRPTP